MECLKLSLQTPISKKSNIKVNSAPVWTSSFPPYRYAQSNPNFRTFYVPPQSHAYDISFRFLAALDRGRLYGRVILCVFFDILPKNQFKTLIMVHWSPSLGWNFCPCVRPSIICLKPLLLQNYVSNLHQTSYLTSSMDPRQNLFIRIF